MLNLMFLNKQLKRLFWRQRQIWLALLCACSLNGLYAAPVLKSGGLTLPIETPRADAASPAQQALSKGFQALHKRDFKAADAFFKQAAQADKASTAPLLAHAESARVQGDAKAAQVWLQKAVQLKPKDPPTLRALAHWHYAHAEYDKAEKYWRSAIEVAPQWPALKVDLADFQFNVRQDLLKAAELYQEALALDPGMAGAQYALGMVYLKQGRGVDAIARFTESERLSPGNALPMSGHAKALVLRGQTEQALQMLDRALSAPGSSFSVRIDKGELLLSMGRAQEALTEFMQVAKAHPKVVEAQVGMGLAQHQLNQLDAAFQSYRAALQLDPAHALALNNAAWLASQRQDVPDKGLAWAQKAVSLAPQDLRLQRTLAWVRHRRGESVSALKSLQALPKPDKLSAAETQYMVGMVLTDLGRSEEAAAAFREALRQAPEFSQAADARSRLRKLQGG